MNDDHRLDFYNIKTKRILKKNLFVFNMIEYRTSLNSLLFLLENEFVNLVLDKFVCKIENGYTALFEDFFCRNFLD